MSFFKSLSRKWSSYKYRFLPWLALNLKSRRILPIRQKFTIHPDEKYLQDLKELFTSFARPDYTLLFKGSKRWDHFRDLGKLNRLHILEQWGFVVGVGKSRIPGAGRGVFVTKGSVKEGQIVALYPGCVYQPNQPILLQSIGNPYILR